MKKIEAIIKPFKLDEVEALHDVGIKASPFGSKRLGDKRATPSYIEA